MSLSALDLLELRGLPRDPKLLPLSEVDKPSEESHPSNKPSSSSSSGTLMASTTSPRRIDAPPCCGTASLSLQRPAGPGRHCMNSRSTETGSRTSPRTDFTQGYGRTQGSSGSHGLGGGTHSGIAAGAAAGPGATPAAGAAATGATAAAGATSAGSTMPGAGMSPSGTTGSRVPVTFHVGSCCVRPRAARSATGGSRGAIASSVHATIVAAAATANPARAQLPPTRETPIPG